MLDSDVVCTASDPVGVVIGGDDLTLWLAGHTIQGADAEGTDGIADDGTARSGVTIRGGDGGAVTGFDDGIDLDTSNSQVLKLAVTAAGTGVATRGTGNYIYRTSVDMSAGTGFAAIQAEGDDAYLWGNVVTGSPGVSPDDGIVVFGDNPRIVNNSVDGCAFDGIIVGAYTTGMVAYNTVTGCDIGITPSGTGIKVQRNDASGNCLGIVIDDPAGFVRNNDANGNCSTGIMILQPGVTVRDNRTSNNADYGIDAVTGTIDKGANVASGNGVGQCLVVACVGSLPPD